jgi:DNA-binding transcriptional ArsR family regulator
MKPRSDISDPRIIKALTHPLRVSILGALEERTASPSELAEELDAPLGNVSYHVRQLHGLGLIKLVKKTPRRGAIEHHYKAVGRAAISDEAWSETPQIVKESLVAATLGEIRSGVNAAAAHGGFSGPDAHLGTSRLAVDDKGWKAIATELARSRDRIEKIAEESAKRLAKSGTPGGRAATVVTMLFEAQEQAEPDASANNGAARRRTRSKSRR